MKTKTIMAISLDSYNQAISCEVAEPLRACVGGDTKAKVLIIYDGEDENDDENTDNSE